MSARDFTILRKTSLLILILLVFSHHVYASDVYYLQRTIETPHPEENGWFGGPMDVDGDLILISAWQAAVGDELKVGNAYLYNMDGDLIASYHSPVPNSGDVFSAAIDISGDRVLIGDDSPKGEWKFVGKAYIFDTEGTLLKTLEAPTPSYAGAFGANSVCFASNRIIISETGGQTEPLTAGMVHMFDDEGTYLKAIYSPSPKSAGRFGEVIEEGDELFLVNEIGEGEILFPGTVYGFDYDGNHVMTIQAPEPEDHACFGNSMDIYGDKIIIGKYYATVDDVYRAGRAYLFNTDGEHLQTFESPSPDIGARFGFAVSVEGDTVVIGEPNADVSPNMAEGKAYIFDVEGNLLQTLVAPSPGPIALFGWSVNVEGDTIVVGEPWAEVDGELRAGKVHVYGVEPPVTNQEETTVTKSTEITTDSEQDAKDKPVIPGFPYESLLVGIFTLAVALKFLSPKKYQSNFEVCKSKQL